MCLSCQVQPLVFKQKKLYLPFESSFPLGNFKNKTQAPAKSMIIPKITNFFSVFILINQVNFFCAITT